MGVISAVLLSILVALSGVVVIAFTFVLVNIIKKKKLQSNSPENTAFKTNLQLRKYLIEGVGLGVILIIASVLMLGINVFSNGATYSENNSLQDINVSLKWVHQSQFAGNYVAVEKGFYKIHGLNASLRAYNFADSPIDLVASNRAQFGIASASEIMIARNEGIPVKAIAVIYQINPVCAFSLKNSSIERPHDFIGKTIGIEKGVNVEFEYIAMMDNLGINRSQLKEVGIGFEAAELMNGTVDVSTGYVINEPYYAISKGYDVNIIMVEDYGINMYADVFFTTDEMLAQHPDLVNEFVQATIDGWEYSMEHEDEAVDIVMKYAIDKDVAHQRYALKASLPLINTGDVAVGYMDEQGWQNVYSALLLQKININTNVSDCYTSQFISRRDVWHNI